MYQFRMHFGKIHPSVSKLRHKTILMHLIVTVDVSDYFHSNDEKVNLQLLKYNQHIPINCLTFFKVLICICEWKYVENM